MGLGVPLEQLVLLLLSLSQEVEDPLAGLGIPLEQLVLLPLDFGGILLILPRPRQQILECLLGILHVPTGLGLPLPEPGRLLSQKGQLGHPLLGDSKLGTHIPALSGLFGEVVPFHL